jgi:uncharacterized protein YjbI with pentapeptide repeats
MADVNQLKILNQGVEMWNAWRSENPLVSVDLRIADLSDRNFNNFDFNRVNLESAFLANSSFENADFSHAGLDEAIFTESNLVQADFTYCFARDANFSKCNLTKASFGGSNLGRSNFKEACLRDADLSGAICNSTDFSNAELAGADLSRSIWVRANINQANLDNCRVYGISVWDLEGMPASQLNLLITPALRSRSRVKVPQVTVDDLQVAQFIYLILDRKTLRNVINTITSKAVLILGRFTPERKVILDSIAEELRNYNLLPIIFDFEQPENRDFTETIKTLAGISLFIIADITNPSSAPLELQATIPDYKIPFVPIIQTGEKPFAMFSDLLGKYEWVLQPIVYDSLSNLISGFKPAILDRAWLKHQELQKQKASTIETLTIDQFIHKA